MRFAPVVVTPILFAALATPALAQTPDGAAVFDKACDAIEEAPTDIRAFEFISYAQITPDAFLTRLDGALQSVLRISPLPALGIVRGIRLLADCVVLAGARGLSASAQSASADAP